MLLYRNKEVDYMRQQFQETLKVHGIPSKLYPVNRDGGDTVYDFYNDIKETPNVVYGNPINIKIVFQEVPQINTLRNLGWYIKDEDLPYLAYIPTEYLDNYGDRVLITPIVDDKIELTDNPIDDTRSTREYLIKDFKSQGYPNTIYYICKLVPNYINVSNVEINDSEGN